MEGDPAWSTVSIDFVLEEGCWLIERLWVRGSLVFGLFAERNGYAGGAACPELCCCKGSLFAQGGIALKGNGNFEMVFCLHACMLACTHCVLFFFSSFRLEDSVSPA